MERERERGREEHKAKGEVWGERRWTVEREEDREMREAMQEREKRGGGRGGRGGKRLVKEEQTEGRL